MKKKIILSMEPVKFSYAHNITQEHAAIKTLAKVCIGLKK